MPARLLQDAVASERQVEYRIVQHKLRLESLLSKAMQPGMCVAAQRRTLLLQLRTACDSDAIRTRLADISPDPSALQPFSFPARTMRTAGEEFAMALALLPFALLSWVLACSVTAQSAPG